MNEPVIKELLEALKWFIENDETNRGDVPMPEHHGQTWDEINAYWIEGLERGIAAVTKAEAALLTSPETVGGVRAAVKNLLKRGELVECHTEDDAGLDEDGYVEAFEKIAREAALTS